MEQIKKYALQGHEVTVLPLLDEYDVVLAENAWRMPPENEIYLDSHTMPEARRCADLRKALRAAHALVEDPAEVRKRPRTRG